MKLEELPDLDWDKGDGLLPVAVQHVQTGALLKLGYMNRQALRQTLASGRVTFFSRNRAELWTEGEASGHFLEAVAVSADCDNDTILVQALPAGPVCHLGTATCFPHAAPLESDRYAFLGQLERVIAERIAAQPEGSYTARLHAHGPQRLAQRLGQEGVELALAAAGDDDALVLAEAADLLYHLTLMLKLRGMSLAAVMEELELRHAERTATEPAAAD